MKIELRKIIKSVAYTFSRSTDISSVSSKEEYLAFKLAGSFVYAWLVIIGSADAGTNPEFIILKALILVYIVAFTISLIALLIRRSNKGAIHTITRNIFVADNLLNLIGIIVVARSLSSDPINYSLPSLDQNLKIFIAELCIFSL